MEMKKCRTGKNSTSINLGKNSDSLGEKGRGVLIPVLKTCPSIPAFYKISESCVSESHMFPSLRSFAPLYMSHTAKRKSDRSKPEKCFLQMLDGIRNAKREVIYGFSNTSGRG